MLIFCVAVVLLCYNRPTRRTWELRLDSSSLYCWHASVSYLPHLVFFSYVAIVDNGYGIYSTHSSIIRKFSIVWFQGSFSVDSRKHTFGAFMQKSNSYSPKISILWKDQEYENLQKHTEGLDELKKMSTMCLAPIIYLMFLVVTVVNISQKTKKENTEKWNEIIFLHHSLSSVILKSDQLSHVFSSPFYFRFCHACSKFTTSNPKWDRQEMTKSSTQWWMEQMFIFYIINFVSSPKLEKEK